MLWDDYGRVYHVAILFGLGDHLGLSQCDLPGEDLHPLDAHSAKACPGSGKVYHGVGTDGVVLLQRQEAGGRFNGNVGGIALVVGDALDGEAVAADRDYHPRNGRGLAGAEGLNAQNAGVFHRRMLLCGEIGMLLPQRILPSRRT